MKERTKICVECKSKYIKNKPPTSYEFQRSKYCSRDCRLKGQAKSFKNITHWGNKKRDEKAKQE